LYRANNNRDKIFWQRFNKLAKQDQSGKGIVDHDELQRELVSSNKFFMGDAELMIEDMLKAGKIIAVDFKKYILRKDQE
jgi:hypothetical protein